MKSGRHYACGTLTMAAEKAVEEYYKALDALALATKNLENVFRPLIDEAYAIGGEKLAIEVTKRIPDPVVGAFALDRIRYTLPNKKTL